MSSSLHLSNKMQLTIIPTIEFSSKNLWIWAVFSHLPLFMDLDRVINTKVIHPNIARFSSNIWSFKRSILGWPLPKTNTTSETELWDQICTCVLKMEYFLLISCQRYYTIQNHKAFWNSLKIMYQSSAWVL